MWVRSTSPAHADSTVTILDGTTSIGTATVAATRRRSDAASHAYEGANVLTAHRRQRRRDRDLQRRHLHAGPHSPPGRHFLGDRPVDRRAIGRDRRGGRNASIGIYDGATLLGTTTANSSGAWATNVTVASVGVNTPTAQATNSGGTGFSNWAIDLVGANDSLSGGDQMVLYLAPASLLGDAVKHSSPPWAMPNGSDGTVQPAAVPSRRSWAGGTRSIFRVGRATSRAFSTPEAIGVLAKNSNGTNGVVSLSNSGASITGDGDKVKFRSGTGHGRQLRQHRRQFG